jgi:hypothetical protein
MKIPDFISSKYSYFLIHSIERSIEKAIINSKPALSFIADIPLILEELGSNVGLLTSVKSFGVSDFTDKDITFSIHIKLEHSEKLALNLLNSLVSLEIKPDDFIKYIKNDSIYSMIFTYFVNILSDSFFKKLF